MGDGRVALILDVIGLAHRAKVVSEVRDRAHCDLEQEEKALGDSLHTSERKPVLVFQHGETGRMAVDLELVARLEEFPAAMIELANDREVVQYRGQIMPLVRVSEALESQHAQPLQADGSLQVVVYAGQGQSVGLVVDRILDIVEESFVIEPKTGRKGVMGSAVIQKRVTDILDVKGLLASASGSDLFAASEV
jgi:two-component system chemotaxis sensor kinase CheA